MDLLRAHGLAERMDREGHPHDGMRIVWAGRDGFFIDVARHVGKRFMTYGQTQIQEDLFAAADRRGATVLTDVTDVQLMKVETERPYVTFSQHGETARVDCDFVAGCDGFHGVTRAAIPRALLREFEKVYPFGWLGILSPTPPLPDIVYASHRVASHSHRRAVRHSAATTSRCRWRRRSKTGAMTGSGAS